MNILKIFLIFLFIYCHTLNDVEADNTAINNNTLTIYTYDSFVSRWGPGKAISEGFEQFCKCNIRWVTVVDAAAIINRLTLEGSNTKADVVIGLDHNIISNIDVDKYFSVHDLKQEDMQFDGMPLLMDTSMFVPYDWGHLAFIYNKKTFTGSLLSFEDLLAPGLKVAIQNPRSSSPGLGLVLWVKKVYGEHTTEFWRKLSPNILKVSQGWSEAYGLFLEGEADVVLSYTTSPAYHIINEDMYDYDAAIFREGHYLHIEVMARSLHSKKKKLADKFMLYMLSDNVQDLLPVTNWMYPVTKTDKGIDETFNRLNVPDKVLFMTADEVAEVKREVIQEWDSAIR